MKKFVDDKICYLIKCSICKTPMMVYKKHGLDISFEDEQHMRDRCQVFSFIVFDDKYWKLVSDNRHQENHIHWHMELVNSLTIENGVERHGVHHGKSQ